MKVFRYIIYILIVASAAVSCMAPFDPKFDKEPVIFLEAFPGVEDMVVFSILPAYSLSNSAERIEFTPEIKFIVNDREVPVVLNKGFCVSSKYKETLYIADYKPVPGDVMSVEVSSDGFKTIYAETSVPFPFPDRKIDYRELELGDRKLSVLHVSFEDDADTHCAYGLQIIRENRAYYPGDSTSVSVSKYAGDMVEEYYDMAPESMEGIYLRFNGWSMRHYGSLSGWDDGTFNGEYKTFSVVPSIVYGHDDLFEETWEEDIYDDMGYEIIGKRINVSRNKLGLYTMTDEFYRYAVAQGLIDDNADFFAGIAPSNFCYSNVMNGYGAFAGVYCVETDWITREFIENNR